MRGRLIEYPRNSLLCPKDGLKVLQRKREHLSITDGETNDESALNNFTSVDNSKIRL